MIVSGASRGDPRVIGLNTVAWTINVDKTGLTPASVAISGPTLLLLATGQSIASNFNGTSTITIGDPNVQMLHPVDGTLWEAAEPLIGNDFVQSSPVSYLARDLVAEGVFPRVIIMACALGASRASEQAPGGRFENNIANMVLRAKAYGWLDDLRVKQAMIWSQGVSEGILPPNNVTSAQYQASFNAIRARVVELGWTGPTWVEKQTEWAGPSPNAGPIRDAQTAVVNGTTIRAGIDFDTLMGPGDKHDGTHLNATGQQKWADGYRALITAWAAT